MCCSRTRTRMVDIMTHLHDYVPKANTPSDPEKLLIVPYCGDQLHSTSQYLSAQNVYETKLHNFLTDTSFGQICPLLCKVPKAYQKSKSKHKAFLQKSLQSQGNSQGSTWTILICKVLPLFTVTSVSSWNPSQREGAFLNILPNL